MQALVLLFMWLPAGRGGEMVSLYEFGADEMGYLSLPEKQPVGGILMIPDAFGPRGVVKQRCDLMAKLGYVTLVVDLYNGSASENPEVTRRLQDKVQPEAAVAAIQAGMKLLGESPRYRTGTLLLVVWGDNLSAAVQAAAGMEGLQPDAISWLEPENLGPLTVVAGSGSVAASPLQIIMRKAAAGESFDSFMARFDQLRGTSTAVHLYEKERGFLLEVESTPAGVDAWSAMIDFWQQVVERTYQAEAVTPREPPAAEMEGFEPEEKPLSNETRSKLKHPRLN